MPRYPYYTACAAKRETKRAKNPPPRKIFRGGGPIYRSRAGVAVQDMTEKSSELMVYRIAGAQYQAQVADVVRTGDVVFLPVDEERTDEVAGADAHV